MASEHSESIASKDRITEQEDTVKEEITDTDLTDGCSGLNSSCVNGPKACDERKAFSLSMNEKAVLLATDMHNIIVPVKKNGAVRLPVSYLKARQHLLRNKKIPRNTNIITVRSSEDNEGVKIEKNEIQSCDSCDSTPSIETSYSSSLTPRISKRFAIAAAEENKRTLILNQNIEGSNLPTKRKLAEGFFAKVPDKDNPDKLIMYYVIPTETSVNEIISLGKRLAMTPLPKDRPSYLVEPLPELDFEITINDDTPAGEVIKQLCKNKFASRMLFNSHIQFLIEDPVHQLFFMCKICDKKFLQQGRFLKHCEFYHHGQRVHHCSVCKEYFESRKILAAHKNSVHAENNICEICEMSFTTHRMLIIHLKVHRFSDCDSCDYKNPTPYPRSMEKHKEKHYRNATYLKKSLFDEPKPWCALCQIGLESDKHLEVHNRIRHTRKLLQQQEQDKGA